MDVPTLRDRVLYNIATGLSVPRNALTTLSKSQNVIYRVLKKLEEAEYIRKSSFTVSVHGTKYARTYYAIAKKGIEHLCNNCRSDYPWMSGYELNAKHRPSITGELTISSKMRNRLMKSATATVMMHEALIPAAPVAVGTNPAEDGSWMSYLMQNWPTPDTNDGPRYYNSREVKSIRAGVGIQGVKDGATDRYVGILIGNHQRALVYVPNNEGFTWNSGRITSEMQTLSSFCGILDAKQRGANGIILIPNAKELRRLYEDEQGVRGNDTKNHLGRSADHLWVVPVQYDGISQLRRIAYDDLNALRENVILSAVEKVGLLKNDDTVFPLRDESGRLFAYGADLDIRLIQQIQLYQKRDPQLSIGIVCYRWQAAYYNEILNGCRYLILQQ